MARENVTACVFILISLSGRNAYQKVNAGSWQGGTGKTSNSQVFAPHSFTPATKEFKKITETSGFTSHEKQELLRLHNVFRSNVTPSAGNMNFLAWDEALADLAQKWANGCQFRHGFPPNTFSEPIGQNLYKGWDSSGTRAMALWYEERKYYDIKSDTCDLNRKCGHYTQLVWAKTERVGCGRKKCPSAGFLVVCHYLPAGNVAGMALYHVSRPCSQCDTEDGGLCSERLCVTASKCKAHPVLCRSSCPLRCENCGTLNLTACRCLCRSGWDSLDCSSKCEDKHGNCGRSPGWPSASSCSMSNFAVENRYCRQMCGKCESSLKLNWLSNGTCCAGASCPEGHVLDLERRPCRCRLQCPGPLCNAEINRNGVGLTDESAVALFTISIIMLCLQQK